MSKLRQEARLLTRQNKKFKDYDPEDERSQDEELLSNSDSEQENVNGGREHYEKVGKSKLRQTEERALGSKYAGTAVSRSVLTGDDGASDPFAETNLTASDDSDPFAQSDAESGSADGEEQDTNQNVEKLRLRGADPRILENTHEQLSRDGSEASGSTDEEIDSNDSGSGTDSELGDDEKSSANISSKRADLKAHLSQATSLATGLAQAASADAKKGRAVKTQYQTFDRLLDARMKLQKGFVASDSIRTVSSSSNFATDAEIAIADAQRAASRLFDMIGSFREDIYKVSNPGNAVKKRKTPPDEHLPGLATMWNDMTVLEDRARPCRIKVIDKWSNKVRAADPNRMASASKPKLLDLSSHDDRVSAILQTYIINEQDKHFQPSISADVDSSVDISTYDDDMFYQSLLRDLIATRAATSNAAQNLSLSVLPQRLHAPGNRQNKQVRDTKASKGRKIRYNVHEKLQNFMAAEGDTGRDTAMWTERGKNEFFGSLFGQDRALNENEDMTDGEDGATEIAALRLFST